jgi:uncharacterized protein (TIGR00251 family)
MLLTVRVQPGASKESFAWDEARGWLVRVRAPPVDGKANERVCAFLARDVFGEAGVKIRVRVRSGDASRGKVLELDGDDADIARVLEALRAAPRG